MNRSKRVQFVEVAASLFTANGFGPVGLDQIIDAVGVTKTTFYKHFESKDALIVAVLAHRHEQEMTALASDVASLGGTSGRAQILAIFDVFDEWFSEADFRGCIFLRAATEFPQENDPIHRAAVFHADEMKKFLRERAILAGADGPTADAIAAQLVVLTTGSVIARQITNNPAAARVARRTAELLLDELLPQSATNERMPAATMRA